MHVSTNNLVNKQSERAHLFTQRGGGRGDEGRCWWIDAHLSEAVALARTFYRRAKRETYTDCERERERDGAGRRSNGSTHIQLVLCRRFPHTEVERKDRRCGGICVWRGGGGEYWKKQLESVACPTNDSPSQEFRLQVDVNLLVSGEVLKQHDAAKQNMGDIHSLRIHSITISISSNQILKHVCLNVHIAPSQICNHAHSFIHSLLKPCSVSLNRILAAAYLLPPFEPSLTQCLSMRLPLHTHTHTHTPTLTLNTHTHTHTHRHLHWDTHTCTLTRTLRLCFLSLSSMSSWTGQYNINKCNPAFLSPHRVENRKTEKR